MTASATRLRIAMALFAAAALAGFTVPALAHNGVVHGAKSIWHYWEFDPIVLTALALSAWLYVRGVRRAWAEAGTGRSVTRRQAAFYAAGWSTLALATVTPIHGLGEVSFAMHMTEHELIMVVAAPLLVFSRPLVAFLWAFPLSWRRALASIGNRRGSRSFWRSITHPLGAWIIHAIILWGWHAPVLFQATLTSNTAHIAQHVSLLAASLLFWWSLFAGRQGAAGLGAALGSLFTTTIHTGVLGALLTFSTRIWYPAYAVEANPFGLPPLEDQQIAGLIMWVPAGVAYVVAALGLLASSLNAAEASARRWELEHGRRTTG